MKFKKSRRQTGQALRKNQRLTILFGAILVSVTMLLHKGNADFLTKDNKHYGDHELPRISVIFSTLYGRRSEQDENAWKEVWAVKSWSRFADDVQPDEPPIVIGFVDDDQYCDTELKSLSNVLCIQLNCPTGIPTISCLFEAASEYSTENSLAIFSNGDIVFPRKLSSAFNVSREKFGIFSMVGQRLDLTPSKWMHLTNSCSLEKIESFSEMHGILHPNYGIDFFVVPSNFLYLHHPGFYIGRWRWDNWMLYKLIQSGIPTVDASAAAPVIHFGEYKYNHQTRSGNEENDLLAKALDQSRFLLGKTSNTQFVVRDTMTIAPREQEDASVLKVIRNHGSGTLTLLIATDKHLPLIMNWLCWAKLAGFSNYVLVAFEGRTYDHLTSLNEDVLFLERQATQYDQIVFPLSMVSLVLDLLQIGTIITISDPSVLQVGHEDSTNASCSIFVESINMHASHNRLIKLNPRNSMFDKIIGMKGIVIKAVEKCLVEKNIFDDRTFGITSCLQRVLEHFTIPICEFYDQDAVNYRAFFQDGLLQKNGLVPKRIILPDEGDDELLNLLSRHGMLLWNRENASCNSYSIIEGVSPQIRKKWTLKIRIFSSDRPASFKRLLHSLLESSSVSMAILVEISVDFPSIGVTDEYLECVNLARKFRWRHPVIVTIHTETQGLIKQWVSSKVQPHQLLLVLEDDMQISPFFFRYIKRAIDHFYVDELNYDHRNFGIMLHPQHQIDEMILPAVLGRNAFKVGMSKVKQMDIDHLFVQNDSFYRYQLLSTWGPIFFPDPWSKFQTWASDEILKPAFEPCVPGLKSNPWTRKERPGKIWSTYFTRFVHDMGMFGVHINYLHRSHIDRTNGLPKMLLYNHKEKGLNSGFFIQDFTPHLLQSEEAFNEMADFPNLTDTVLYDLHFEPAKTTEELLSRSILFRIGIHKCFVLGQFSKYGH
eukprot:jgi/Picsp_1/4529/NSC_06750-R1_protein